MGQRVDPKYSNLSEKEITTKFNSWAKNYQVHHLSKIDSIILSQEIAEEIWKTIKYNIRHLFVKKALIRFTVFAILSKEEYENITKSYIYSLDNAINLIKTGNDKVAPNQVAGQVTEPDSSSYYENMFCLSKIVLYLMIILCVIIVIINAIKYSTY